MTELRSFEHIYFLGIGGIGMSAIAKCCLLWGIKVSGYDRQSSALTEEMAAAGAKIHFTDDPQLIDGKPDLVIYTPAIPADSKLKQHFIDQRVQMVKRAEALGWLTNGVDTIAVAGTHGKTTTSSMISFLLRESGVEHTALLGGVAANYHSNFISDSLDLMVVEADEYDRSFHKLFPRWVVLTAMDPDHLDIYGTYEEMLKAYRQFLTQIQPGGLLLYRHDLLPLIGDEVMKELDAKDVESFSYGLEEGQFHTTDLHVEKGVWKWKVASPWGETDGLTLLMPGRHNVLNATAACVLAENAGGGAEEIIEALAAFKGVSRRFEIRYQDGDNVVIDDYAHHPEELVAAITAAKETYESEVTGVFQPHLYSRTRDLADGFAAALDLLDVPVIIDIYPAREEPIEGVSSQTIFDRMKNPRKQYLRGDTWVEWVVKTKPKVLITLGAGDLDKHLPDVIRKMYGGEEHRA